MKFDTLIEKAVTYCVLDKVPFVLFALPGEDKFRFYASDTDDEGCSPAFSDDEDCFYINFFDNDEPYTAGVRFSMTAAQLVSRRESEGVFGVDPQIRPHIPATLRASYHDAFSNIIPRLKAEGGKVVLSRHRTIFSEKPLLQSVGEYLSLTDSTFRYLAYTPETGLWFGSTPELLVESDSRSNELRTMALAGTRPVTEDGAWDEKNSYEQSIVTDYIAEILKGEGLDVTVEEPYSRRFLNIEHLCTEITAKGVMDVPYIMSELSPTPAVAGYPRETALEEICRYETHRRYCYGGYVGVRIGGDYHAYVNLRCCFLAAACFCNDISGWLCNLYAGGGIVASSKEESEWEETAAKMSALSGILLGQQERCGCEGHIINVSSVSITETPTREMIKAV